MILPLQRGRRRIDRTRRDGRALRCSERLQRERFNLSTFLATIVGSERQAADVRNAGAATGTAAPSFNTVRLHEETKRALSLPAEPDPTG
jgi:hypothetical protein